MASPPTATDPAKAAIQQLHALPDSSPESLTDWLNHHLDQNAPSSSSAKLAHLADSLRSLSLQLSADRQDTRAQVESSLSDLLVTVPKLNVETAILRQAARSLQHQIHDAVNATSSASVSASASTSQAQSVDQALANITTLSLINQSLVNARDTLREAQAWSTLESQVTACLEEKRFDQAADLILKARASIHVFNNAQGPFPPPLASASSSSSSSSTSLSDRLELLDRLTTLVQDQLSPVLQSAVQSRHIESIERIASQMTKIDRLQAGFCDIYFTTRTSQLSKSWSDRNQDAEPAASLLSTLFGQVLALLGEERMFAQRIFADRRLAAELLLQTAFGSLKPPISEYLHRSSVTQSVDRKVAFLVKAYQSALDAAASISELLPTTSSTKTDAPLPVPELHPQSMPSIASKPPWTQILFESFLEWQTSFADLEGQAMIDRSAASQSSALGSNRAKQLQETIQSSIDSARESLQRSKAFTNSLASAPLINSIEKLLSDSINRIKDDNQAHARTLVENVVGRVRSAQKTSRGFASEALTYDDRDQGLATADWDEFKRGTDLLAACRDALTSLSSLEQLLASHLSETGAMLPDKTWQELSDEPMTDALSVLAHSPLNSQEVRDTVAAASRAQSWGEKQQRILSLLPRSDAAVLGLARSVQRFLHDLVLAPFMPQLEAYASLSVWGAKQRPGETNEYDLTMPKFSLSPTDLMARIGEGLLNLPRLFEAYADRALTFALPTEARERRHVFSAVEDETEEHTLTLWLSSLTSTLLDQLLHSVIGSIPRLSSAGSAQMSADLDYLANICVALNSTAAEATVRTWRDATGLEDEEGRRILRNPDAGQDERLRALAGSEAFRTVASLRGWT